MGTFTITATNLEWIGGAKDDPQDQCLHGHAIAMVGSRKLEYDATVSSTALSSYSGVIRSFCIYASGTLSIHTLCQRPLCGVYQIPPRCIFCFPRL